MEIILLERIKNLGDLGDTVEVRSGYGRNYLLPRGKALPATEANRKVFEERKAELMKKSQGLMSAARSRAEAIGGKTLTITALASDEGKLYGSVGPAEIAAAAAKLGLEVDKNEIIVPDGPIRQAGTYDVVVHLHPEVETSLSVVIERQNG